jgi:hypothetical protein
MRKCSISKVSRCFYSQKNNVRRQESRQIGILAIFCSRVFFEKLFEKHGWIRKFEIQFGKPEVLRERGMNLKFLVP